MLGNYAQPVATIQAAILGQSFGLIMAVRFPLDVKPEQAMSDFGAA